MPRRRALRPEAGAPRGGDRARRRCSRRPTRPRSWRCRDVDLVSICTRTDTHVELAIAALEAGKHVLVEKPVGITADAVAQLAVVAAQHAGTLCVPAHCMRFWPGWDTLHEAVTSGRYGRALSATFQRLSSPPAWSPDFYADSRALGRGARGPPRPRRGLRALVLRRSARGDVARLARPRDDALPLRAGRSAPRVRRGRLEPRARASASGCVTSSCSSARRWTSSSAGTRGSCCTRRAEASRWCSSPTRDTTARSATCSICLLGRESTPRVTIEDALAVACLLDAERESLESGRPVIVG